MTEIETVVTKLVLKATAKEQAKTRKAIQRADQWRERAQTYKDHMTRYQRELAEARSILRKSA